MEKLIFLLIGATWLGTAMALTCDRTIGSDSDSCSGQCYRYTLAGVTIRGCLDSGSSCSTGSIVGGSDLGSITCCGDADGCNSGSSSGESGGKSGKSGGKSGKSGCKSGGSCESGLTCKHCTDCDNVETTDVGCSSGQCYKYKTMIGEVTSTNRGCLSSSSSCETDAVDYGVNVGDTTIECCDDKDGCNSATLRTASAVGVVAGIGMVLTAMWYQQQ